jgi:hypothetical protein
MLTISSLFAMGNTNYRPQPGVPLDFKEAAAWPINEVYDLLEAYYLNNGLYWSVERALYEKGFWHEPIRPLRNPAHRAVEFYAGKLWPGTLPDALPLVTKSDQVTAAIQQVWEWSNWTTEKQVFARKLPMLGDTFIKVAQPKDKSRVFMQLIDPRYVLDDNFEKDERGNLVYIRLDIPRQTHNDEGELVETWWTEVWDKRNGQLWLRIWEHEEGPDADLDNLEDPTVEKWSGEPEGVEQVDQYLPFDFIPIVHAKCQDIGQDRGLAVIVPALDKIDELNRTVTRLHQVLYNLNDVLWALKANAVDPSGRPVPAPPISVDGTQKDAGDVVTIGGSRMVKLPGTSDLVPLVPDINYDAALKVAEAQMAEIERDLPELAYFRLREQGELSGKAIALLLGDAIDRALEIRGNGEAAMIRAQAMALTIGREARLFDESIGTYENGDFEHSFDDRPVIVPTIYEQIDTVKTGKDAGFALVTLMRTILRWTDAEIEQALSDLGDEKNQEQLSMAMAALNAARNFNRGEGANAGSAGGATGA